MGPGRPADAEAGAVDDGRPPVAARTVRPGCDGGDPPCWDGLVADHRDADGRDADAAVVRAHGAAPAPD